MFKFFLSKKRFHLFLRIILKKVHKIFKPSKSQITAEQIARGTLSSLKNKYAIVNIRQPITRFSDEHMACGVCLGSSSYRHCDAETPTLIC